MTEEYVSRRLYELAAGDSEIDVVSWQSVDGKGYFAADVKLRLPDQRRMEPDLILTSRGALWVIEVKGLHSEAVADECKLEELVETLGVGEVVRQIEIRSRLSLAGLALVLAVAYGVDDIEESGCRQLMPHIDWSRDEGLATSRSLAALLSTLRL